MNEKLNQVHAFVDGELSIDEREQVLRDIKEDPALALEYEWAHVLKDVVHAKCQTEVPEGGWDAARKRIAALDKVKTTNDVVAKFGWAICGVLFIGVATAGYLNQRSRSGTLSSAEVAGIFNFSPGSAKPISQPTRSRVYFGDLQLNARDGSRFVGEESGVVDGHVMACLLYTSPSPRD